MATKPKIGDVYAMEINENQCVYFQYIADDATRDGSPVVRVFKGFHSPDCKPDIDEVVKSSVDFYAHIALKYGFEIGVYKKVGKSEALGLNELAEVWFGEAERFSVAEIVSQPGLTAFDANYSIWHVNEPKITVGVPDNELIDRIEPGFGVDFRELYVRIMYGYYRCSTPFYCNVPRRPLSDADSFVKYHDRMAHVKYYFHFHGPELVRELVKESSGKTFRLTSDKAQANGYSLYGKPFGSVNWGQNEFVSQENFERMWADADPGNQNDTDKGRGRLSGIFSSLSKLFQ